VCGSAVALLTLSLVCTGTGSGDPSCRSPSIVESAARIVRELWGPGAGGDPLTDVSVWRSGAREGGDDGAVRSRRPFYHAQFLSAVTPEAFRTGTFYTPSIGFDPGALARSLETRWRRWQETRIRRRVERELCAVDPERTRCPHGL